MNRVVHDRNCRVLAVGAHPDDLEVGAGGLLARLASDGADVTTVIVTIPSDLVARRDEARAGARLLGARLSLLFDEQPCRVEDLPMHEVVRRLDRLVVEVRPNLVITHSAHDLHWDHGLVHRATVSALRRTSCDLLAYLSSPEMNAHARGMGNCFADISDSIDTKLAAIRCHASQLPKLDVESSRDLARATGRICGCRYAESYEALRVQI